jgi:2-polyprenyl-3-methyl-5-hydroxy-6-metoxy-1,4-benzoquinol methylase
MERLGFKFWYHLRRGCQAALGLLDRLEGWASARLQNYPLELGRRHRANIVSVIQRHHMAAHPDEGYYARQYWHWLGEGLERWAQEGPGTQQPQILDLGCGQGRLTIPLARWAADRGGRVVAVDFSAEVLEEARKLALEEGLAPVIEWREADILTFLQDQPAASYDVVACLEVLYALPGYRQALGEVARVMRPGGVLFAGFRPRYFNLLSALASGRWTALPALLTGSEGYPFGPPTWLAWQSAREVREILTGAGFTVTGLRGIGICSGIAGDPLASLAQPSRLSPAKQEALMEVELTLAADLADCGRYILAAAWKTGNYPED